MATKLTLLAVDRAPGSPWADVIFQAVLSGNYAAGGDTMDLTTLYNQTDPTGKTIDSDQLPVSLEANGQGTLTGNNPPTYRACTATNVNNGNAATVLTPATCLLQCFDGATEEAAGAYGNEFLSDLVIVKAKFLSQR